MAEKKADEAEKNTWIGQMRVLTNWTDSSDHVLLRDKHADSGIGHDWLISATGLLISYGLTMCHLG